MAFLQEGPARSGSAILARVETQVMVCEWARGRQAALEPPVRANALQPADQDLGGAWKNARRKCVRAQLSPDGHWILISCDGDVYQQANPLSTQRP